MKRGAMHRMRTMQELPHVRNHIQQQMTPKPRSSAPSRSGAASPLPAEPKNELPAPSPPQKESHPVVSPPSTTQDAQVPHAPHVFRRIAVDQVTLWARGLMKQHAVGNRGTWLMTSPYPVGNQYIAFHADPLTGAMQEYVVSAQNEIFDRHTINVLDTLEMDGPAHE